MAADNKELLRLLSDYSKVRQKYADKVIARLEQEIRKGIKLDAAVKKLRREFPEFFNIKLDDLLVNSALDGMGVTGVVVDAGKVAILKELSRPWDPSGFNLSKKIHTASKKIYDEIVNTLSTQMRANKSVIEIARALYDGYGYGNVVVQQDLPKYLKAFRHAMPGDSYAIGMARKAAQRVSALSKNGAPNQALKAAYKQLLDVAEKGTDKALKNAIYVAVNEKSRYIAERIARTEAAKAWADGFYEKQLQNKHVVGFRWKLGSRHPMFDICDVYAKADLFNLGPGVFPKDQVPPSPAHPHCLCRVSEVYWGEIDLSRTNYNADDGVNRWLAGLTDEQRNKVLGLNGANDWSNGDSWRGSLRGWQEPISPTTRLKPEFIKGLMEQNLFPADDNFIKELAERNGMRYTVGKQGVDRFYSDDGWEIYPPNDGFIGKPKIETLTKNSILIDRYGKETGSFVAPKGTTYTERALPKGSDSKEYHVYRVKQDIELVLSGQTAAWFGESGGGWQYKLPDRIANLRDYLEEVERQ
mgnify:CR=1 FL=1